jgi:N-acyl homoserine lactone hydrolase
MLRRISLVLLALTSACATPYGDDDAVSTADAITTSDIDVPGPIEVETIVSARWTADTAGLVDLGNPKTRELAGGKVPIVLAVHVVRHPKHGLFVIDTGVPRGWRTGAKDNVSGLIAGPFVADVAPVVPLADIVGGDKLAGVFFTHLHIDHVLGLPDVPKGTPLFAGPGEKEAHGVNGLAFGRAIGDLLEGHDLRDVAFGDVFGDGSFYALHMPGHSRGSTAYLARTTKGPVLFVGDCSHTIWGWEHDVVPGIFTEDHAANVKSLAALKKLTREHPTMRVVVGHETDGAGTGVQPRRR